MSTNNSDKLIYINKKVFFIVMVILLILGGTLLLNYKLNKDKLAYTSLAEGPSVSPTPEFSYRSRRTWVSSFNDKSWTYIFDFMNNYSYCSKMNNKKDGCNILRDHGFDSGSGLYCEYYTPYNLCLPPPDYFDLFIRDVFITQGFERIFLLNESEKNEKLIFDSNSNLLIGRTCPADPTKQACGQYARCSSVATVSNPNEFYCEFDRIAFLRDGERFCNDLRQINRDGKVIRSLCDDYSLSYDPLILDVRRYRNSERDTENYLNSLIHKIGPCEWISDKTKCQLKKRFLERIPKKAE